MQRSAWLEPGDGLVLLNNVECAGGEEKLAVCNSGDIDCYYGKDAGVECEGKST